MNPNPSFRVQCASSCERSTPHACLQDEWQPDAMAGSTRWWAAQSHVAVLRPASSWLHIAARCCRPRTEGTDHVAC